MGGVQRSTESRDSKTKGGQPKRKIGMTGSKPKATNSSEGWIRALEKAAQNFIWKRVLDILIPPNKSLKDSQSPPHPFKERFFSAFIGCLGLFAGYIIESGFFSNNLKFIDSFSRHPFDTVQLSIIQETVNIFAFFIGSLLVGIFGLLLFATFAIAFVVATGIKEGSTISHFFLGALLPVIPLLLARMVAS